MIYKRKTELSVLIFAFLLHFTKVSCSTTTVATNTTTTTVTTTTTATTTTTLSSGVGEVTESSNNALWLIVGIVSAVILVLCIVAVAGIAYAAHRSKRIHPHSDTESICTESESETYSRPTTASHIKLEQDEEDEAISRPVTMTPFELRKLYIETFPYRNWRRGFDGSLRPKMSLKFVDPRIYSRSKGDERQFREKIYNYEMSDTLTLRSSALSRMMQHSRMPTMSEMETLPEGHFPQLDQELEINPDHLPPHDHEYDHEYTPYQEHEEHLQHQEQNHASPGASSEPDFEKVCMRSDDVELM